MGKWTEVAKGLPQEELEPGPFREKINALKDERRSRALAALAEEYRAVRAEGDAHEEKGKGISARRLALESLIAETFKTEDRDIPFSFENGDRVQCSDQIAVKCADNDKVLAWVKEKGLERLLSVHASRLTSLMKTRIESGEETIELTTDEKGRPRGVLLGGGVEVAMYPEVKFVKKAKK